MGKEEDGAAGDGLSYKARLKTWLLVMYKNTRESHWSCVRVCYSVFSYYPKTERQRGGV